MSGAVEEQHNGKKKGAVSLDHFAFAQLLKSVDIETAEGGARTRDLRES